MLKLYAKDVESLKAIGSVEKFEEKFRFLKKKWLGPEVEDSHASRLMTPILKFKTHPIILSIISNNLEYFKEHYKDERYQALNVDLILLLERACLAGSKEVANFLLVQLQIDITSEKYEQLLGYVAASQNIEWAKEIATALAQKGRKIPLSVYSEGNQQNRQAIKIIYESFEEQRDSKRLKVF